MYAHTVLRSIPSSKLSHHTHHCHGTSTDYSPQKVNKIGMINCVLQFNLQAWVTLTNETLSIFKHGQTFATIWLSQMDQMLIRQTLLEPCWSLHVCSQAQEAVQYTILLAVNSVHLWYLFSCESFYSWQSGTRQHYALLPGSMASYGERTHAFKTHLVTYLANWPLYTPENGLQCVVSEPDPRSRRRRRVW